LSGFTVIFDIVTYVQDIDSTRSWLLYGYDILQNELKLWGKIYVPCIMLQTENKFLRMFIVWVDCRQ